MSVNKRLALGVALVLLSPLVSVLTFCLPVLYYVFPFQNPLAVERSLLALSSLATVIGALLLITQYLSASNNLEPAYRRVDKGMAAAVGLYCLADILPLLFFGVPWFEAFTSFSLICLWTVWIASKACALVWMYGLWYLRPRVVLLAVLGMIAVMAIPLPSPDSHDFPSQQQDHHVIEQEGQQEKDLGLLESAGIEAEDLDHGAFSVSPDSPEQVVCTTTAVTVEIPFRGYFTLLAAYSFMRLGGRRQKREESEPEAASA